MSEQIELRGLNNIYEKKNTGKRYEVFHDKYNNNTIIFTPYDDCDTNSICNGLREEAYQYLINTLNNNKNIAIHWTQIEGTTSDYVIYKNVSFENSQLKSHNKTVEALSETIRSGDNSYKYTEVINGERIKIDF